MWSCKGFEACFCPKYIIDGIHCNSYGIHIAHICPNPLIPWIMAVDTVDSEIKYNIKEQKSKE